MYWRVGRGECVGLVCGGERHWVVGILGEVQAWGRGSCPLREVSTGQGGRRGHVVGGLLSTEEGVARLRPWRALAPWEVWRGAAGGGVVSPRSWKALGPREVWRCGTKGDVDRLRLWTALAPWEVWRSFQSQGIADCWVNKNSLRSMLSSKN